MEAHRQVARVGVAQDAVDELGVRAVVLVDLEPDARRRRPARRGGRPSIARAPACMPMLIGHASSPASTRSIANGGSSKPAVMNVVTPAESAGGSSSGVDRVDVGVDGARRGDEPVGHVRLRVRADDEVDAVADRRAPGPADARDPPVLDADVGLDDADDRVDDERAGEDDVELRRVRVASSHCAIRERRFFA